MSISPLPRDPSLGIKYLMSHGIIASDPSAIGEFLFSDGLSKQAICEYFGQLSNPLTVQVAEEFVKLLNLHQMGLDVALRRLMQHVQPDGESQKIEFSCKFSQNPTLSRMRRRWPENSAIHRQSECLLTQSCCCIPRCTIKCAQTRRSHDATRVHSK